MCKLFFSELKRSKSELKLLKHQLEPVINDALTTIDYLQMHF
jgi:hypothetical protein